MSLQGKQTYTLLLTEGPAHRHYRRIKKTLRHTNIKRNYHTQKKKKQESNAKEITMDFSPLLLE